MCLWFCACLVSWCRGCVGRCDWCLSCEACSLRCVAIGSMRVSSCRCCVLVSRVQPVIVLRA